MYITPYKRDLFDDFSSPFEHLFNGFDSHANTKNFMTFMTTDVIEKENGLELIMDLPGVKKEDIKIELSEGYLVITASSKKESEEKDKQGNYIRKERQSGKYTRSFYVGENITEDDIKAKFENGALTLNFPKNQDNAKTQKKTITIED